MSSRWTSGPADRAEDAVDADVDVDEVDVADADAEAEVMARIAETRARLREVPAAQVVANHAMGLWELAAIHLSSEPPALSEASLAIDAVGALLEAVGDRLGDNGVVLNDALAQIRLAFVQVRSSGATAGGPY